MLLLKNIYTNHAYQQCNFCMQKLPAPLQAAVWKSMNMMKTILNAGEREQWKKVLLRRGLIKLFIRPEWVIMSTDIAAALDCHITSVHHVLIGRFPFALLNMLECRHLPGRNRDRPKGAVPYCHWLQDQSDLWVMWSRTHGIYYFHKSCPVFMMIYKSS